MKQRTYCLLPMLALLTFMTNLLPQAAAADSLQEKIFEQANFMLRIKVSTKHDVILEDGSVATYMSWSYLSAFIIEDNDGKWVLSAGHLKGEDDIVAISAYFRSKTKNPEALELVGYDPRVDVALLKFVNPKATDGLPAVKLGCSAKLKVGQSVISLGIPSPTLTLSESTGMINNFITNINLSLRVDDVSNLIATQPRLIIHDSVINFGSSGGPLLNESGEVVGINVMIVSNRNMGFATPIDDVKQVLPIMKKQKGGEVKHSPLQMFFDYSVRMDELDLMSLDIDGRPPKIGVMITRVLPKSMAQKAGFRPGDIILFCDGKPINDVVKLYKLIYLETDLTKKFNIKIDRYGMEITLPLWLSELSDLIDKEPKKTAPN